MVESNFQFTDPSLSYINFKENKNFMIEKGKEIEISTNMTVSIASISESESAVGLLIKVGSEEENSPFYLETEVVANFRWSGDLKQDNIDTFLNQNAPALLLSYARPIVSLVTNSSHFPAYNIPFINFTK